MDVCGSKFEGVQKYWGGIPWGRVGDQDPIEWIWDQPVRRRCGRGRWSGLTDGDVERSDVGSWR
jgi:hypothetical protein